MEIVEVRITQETCELAEKKGIKFTEIPTQSAFRKLLRDAYDLHVQVTPYSKSIFSSSLCFYSMGWSNFATYEDALEKALFEATKKIDTKNKLSETNKSIKIPSF